MKQTLQIDSDRYEISFYVRDYRTIEVDEIIQITKEAIKNTNTLEDAKEVLNIVLKSIDVYRLEKA